ncbi:MAG: hypothetical protein R3D03_14340 [Geminicoccaceae bacterium]
MRIDHPARRWRGVDVLRSDDRQLCAFGDSRDAAIARLRDAIDGYVIEGPGHNLLFLNALLSHPRFVEDG